MKEFMWKSKIFKIFCWFGIHFYEDHIKIDGLTKNGLPFLAKEVCKGCGKVRNEITGHIEPLEPFGHIRKEK